MLRVLVWVLAAPEGSACPKPSPHQHLGMAPGCAETGLCPHGRTSSSSCPAAQPTCFGKPMRTLAWLDNGRISPAGGSNISTLMGTTDFTLRDTKHRTFPCPSVPAAAGRAQAAHGGCCGHARPTVTRTWGQWDSWLHPEPRDTAWAAQQLLEGMTGGMSWHRAGLVQVRSPR